MTETTHAARSPEFLSRLYDGEVLAAERAAFEAHRSGCDECRLAADTFAASLAAFRASPTAPAAADLSARILRKIRAQSPSRRPFGVMFGIDVRWAGVFVAALLVVLISAPALLRRPEASSAPAAPAAIPARILGANPETKAAGATRPQREARAEAVRQAAVPAPAPPPVPPKDEAAAKPQGAPAAAVTEAPAEEEKTRSGFAAAPALRKRAATTESAGGQAANAMDSVAAPLRLSVRALDDQGAAPALVSPVSDERFAPLRGSEFVLVVETQGRVRDVMSSRTDTEPVQVSEAAALEALRALRFAPGDRPRRLLVRIE
jgi:hypothetical protein